MIFPGGGGGKKQKKKKKDPGFKKKRNKPVESIRGPKGEYIGHVTDEGLWQEKTMKGKFFLTRKRKRIIKKPADREVSQK